MNIINENEDITRDTTDIKKITRGYCEQVNKTKKISEDRKNTWTDTSIKKICK